MSKFRFKNDAGSITPLILGFTLLIAGIIATLSDVTYLGSAHLALQSEGERLLSASIRQVSAAEYYEKSIEKFRIANGNTVPMDCESTYINLLSAVASADFYLSEGGMKLISYKCSSAFVEFELSTKVSLPFLPKFLEDVNPVLISRVRGGSRYFSD